MPTFEITALERWSVVVEYVVEAESVELATESVKFEGIAYKSHELINGGDEFLEILNVVQREDS